MRTQTSPAGRLIVVTPKYLLVPAQLETRAEKELSAIQAATVDDHNVFSGKLTPLVEPRLPSATRWYLASEPNGDLIYSYLQGHEGPRLETRSEFNTGSVYIDQIEKTVLYGVARELHHPEALDAYIDEYRRETARQRAEAGSRRAELERQHQSACDALSRLVEAVAAGAMPLDMVKAKSSQLIAESDRLTAELELAEREAPQEIALDLKAMTSFERTLRALGSRLDASDGEPSPETEKLGAKLRALIASVTVVPGVLSRVWVVGKIAALIGHRCRRALL